MALYLVQVAYTSEAWASLVKHPQDRLAVVGKAVKKLGGKVVHGWMSFGDYDTVVVLQMPDDITAAAFAIAISAGGACKSVKTTALLATQDGLAAMEKAGTAGYQPPEA